MEYFDTNIYIYTNSNINKRVIEILNESKQYHSSFDIFHLAFCEYNNCKLITFDKGFKKLQKISKVEIEIWNEEKAQSTPN